MGSPAGCCATPSYVLSSTDPTLAARTAYRHLAAAASASLQSRTCGVLILAAAGVIPLRLAGPLVIGGLSVAAVGFCDDIRSVSVAVRMLTHLGAALLAACWLGGTGVAADGLELGVAAIILRVLTVAWMLNLFNFMDGIDGLAASEGAFILLGGAALALVGGASMMGPALIAGAACLGFLKWNWPRAAIFMGDVGSGFLGYTIAVIALYSAQTSGVNLYAWAMLAALFLVDATLTLLRRLVLRSTHISGAPHPRLSMGLASLAVTCSRDENRDRRQSRDLVPMRLRVREVSRGGAMDLYDGARAPRCARAGTGSGRPE